jgi:hypothetical protein
MFEIYSLIYSLSSLKCLVLCCMIRFNLEMVSEYSLTGENKKKKGFTKMTLFFLLNIYIFYVQNKGRTVDVACGVVYISIELKE